MSNEAIHHKHPLPKKDLSRDCTKCIHAKKIDDHTYECDAELYDIKMLTCFVPREEEKERKIT